MKEREKVKLSTQMTFILVMGSFCAAGGQLMFKLGASGREEFWEFVNPWILGGLVVYAAGALFWIYGLSRVQLISVYPFTILTFVFIYLAAIVFFGERPSLSGMAGVGLIVTGLYLIKLQPTALGS